MASVLLVQSSAGQLTDNKHKGVCQISSLLEFHGAVDLPRAALCLTDASCLKLAYYTVPEPTPVFLSTYCGN